MIRKIKTILGSVLLMLSVTTPILLATPAHAQLFSGSKDAACQGANLQNTPCTPQQTAAAEAQIGKAIQGAMYILSVVVGVIAVIMLIVGGMKYVTSSGDSNNVNSAKNTILYAVIGIAVAALAQIIARFVLGRITASNSPAPPTP